MSAAALAAREPPAPPPAPNPADYAVPVEALTLGKAKGKWTEQPFTVGGYYFASDTFVSKRSEASFLEILGSRQMKKQVTVKFRFAKHDATPISNGRCTMTTKMWSGLFNTADNSLYICQIDEKAPVQFALQAIVPDIEAESGAFLSIARDDPDKYKVLKARMMYHDALYEAIPTGFDLQNEAHRLRVATGYSITRDGRPVGRIDFKSYRGNWSDTNGSHNRKSIITAPISDADGREAVILLAAQMMVLPEANSPVLQAD